MKDFNMNRRLVLAAAGFAAGGALLPLSRTWAQAGATTVPSYARPKLSAPLPDPLHEGPSINDVTMLGYVVEDRLMSGVAPVYAPSSEVDYTIPAPLPGEVPSVMGGSVSSNPEGPPADRPGLPAFDTNDLSVRTILHTAPYTTRLIIYRPRDMRRFSGNVIIEPMHPNGGGSMPMWSIINRFLCKRGDIYIGVQHPRNFAWLQYHKPGRYASLSSPDFSQVWGMLADAARLLKDGGSASPVPVKARRAYMTGYSFTGLVTTTFAKRHHGVNRMADGGPLFDGYPIGTGFGPMPPLDVPVMIGANQYSTYNDSEQTFSSTSPSTATRSNREGFDADGPMTRRRRYEIVGFQHSPLPLPESGSANSWSRGNRADLRCQAQWPAGATNSPNLLGRAFYEGMFRNMSDWVDKGIAPPRAPLIETANGKPVLDEFGNPRGGLRMPDITVPVASYATGTKECLLTGWMVPFTPARLRELYGNWDTYLKRYAAAADALVAQRFITAERAEEMKLAVAHNVPDF